MKISNHIIILYSLLAISPISYSQQLVFPPSQVDPDTHIYERLSDPPKTYDINAFVNSENLVTTLMELLKQPSKSCQETKTTQKAKQMLEQVGGPLEIKVTIDDLPQHVSKLSEDEKADIYCNNGQTAPESGNLIAFIPGNIPAPSWNLSFHLDTNQTKFEGFRRDGDHIYPPSGSPLGADDKAGAAIIIEILRIIDNYKIPHGDIRIVGLVAEEDSAAGAQLVEGEAFRGDISVSIDGTDPDKIGHAAPTMYNGYITVHTQTSHPSKIDEKKSVSACAVGTQILAEAGFMPDGHPPGRPDVVLHSYFTSCGVDNRRFTAKGEPVADYQYNTISPYWTSAWQMRSLEGPETAQNMVNNIVSTINRVCNEASKGRTPVECSITDTDKPGLVGYTVPVTAPSIQLLKTGFEKTSKNLVRINAKQFGAFNGNFIKSRFNEEMLIIGTGADQIHTNEETVSISGMARVTRGLLAAMLESYAYRLVKN